MNLKIKSIYRHKLCKPHTNALTRGHGAGPRLAGLTRARRGAGEGEARVARVHGHGQVARAAGQVHLAVTGVRQYRTLCGHKIALASFLSMDITLMP